MDYRTNNGATNEHEVKVCKFGEMTQSMHQVIKHKSPRFVSLSEMANIRKIRVLSSTKLKLPVMPKQ